MPIGPGIHFFWSWKSHGKTLLKKSGHPVLRIHSTPDVTLLFTYLFTGHELVLLQTSDDSPAAVWPMEVNAATERDQCTCNCSVNARRR